MSEAQTTVDRRGAWDALNEREKKVKQVTAPIHFIERLKERYDLDMTHEEYHALLASKTFVGYFKRTEMNSIGKVQFKGVDIWALYNADCKLFTTAFTPTIETDSRAMVDTCFPRSSRHVAAQIHDIIVEELASETTDFPTRKDAAIYYLNNCKSPKLLIHRYVNGSVPTWLICREIDRIMRCQHPVVKIDLRRIEIATKKEEPAYDDHEDRAEQGKAHPITSGWQRFLRLWIPIR